MCTRLHVALALRSYMASTPHHSLTIGLFTAAAMLVLCIQPAIVNLCRASDVVKDRTFTWVNKDSLTYGITLLTCSRIFYMVSEVGKNRYN